MRALESDYRPRRPETTPLYGVVRRHLESWLAQASARERRVPDFVERELREFLDCGIPANGFLRLRCDDCGSDRVVPFSCKRRGFCPSCGGRHMADTAAHLIDRVLPRVPVRQWVLTLPFGLRYRLGYDRELTADVLHIFVRSLFASLRRRGCAASKVQLVHCGAVTFVQRFGGALNLNVHFHTLAIDGVYHQNGPEPEPRFRPLPSPTDQELERVLDRVVRGIARLLERRGLSEEPDRLYEDDPLLAHLLASAVQGKTATGPRAGQRLLRFGDRVAVSPEKDDGATRIKGLARAHGFSLHAGVAVPANDRFRLERLCRYAGRPPLAQERLREMHDGTLLYELRHRWNDGTTHVAFRPLELIDRLAALVPPPRFHTVRYHGVLASRSKLRSALIPEPQDRSDVENRPRIPGCGHRATAPTKSDTPRAREARQEERTSRPSRYYSWPELMRRVFEVDVLVCPRCGSGPMRILSAIHPPTAGAILDALGLPTRAPPTTPAESAPEEWTLAEP